MRVIDHRLEGAWFGLSPNTSGELRQPTLIVIHATASGGEGPEGDAAYFLRPQSRVSAHLVIGRNGGIAQVVPFDRIAWHAGKSSWGGRDDCNRFSLGIELDNWGRLTKGPDGRVRSWSGEPVLADQVVQLTHKHEKSPSLWETFPTTQLEILQSVIATLRAAYPSLTEVAGHDDIAPGRKFDPGPAFPLERFQQLVAIDDDLVRKVSASRLNVRAGPGMNYPIIGKLARGALVELVEQPVAGWAKVAARNTSAPLSGWTTTQYLNE